MVRSTLRALSALIARSTLSTLKTLVSNPIFWTIRGMKKSTKLDITMVKSAQSQCKESSIMRYHKGR